MRRDDLDHACRELAYGRVKICGLTQERDAQAAWNSGACYGGMIFRRSRLAITLERALLLRQAAPLRWVGVFVDANPVEVQRAVESLELSAVQLHGDESPDQVQAAPSAARELRGVEGAPRARHDPTSLEAPGRKGAAWTPTTRSSAGARASDSTGPWLRATRVAVS